MPDTPTYKHDCDSCVFLGTYMGPQLPTRLVDLYWCGREDNIVSRWSSEGQEYISGRVFAKQWPEVYPDLVEALRRAIEKGLTKR